MPPSRHIPRVECTPRMHSALEETVSATPGGLSSSHLIKSRKYLDNIRGIVFPEER